MYISCLSMCIQSYLEGVTSLPKSVMVFYIITCMLSYIKSFFFHKDCIFPKSIKKWAAFKKFPFVFNCSACSTSDTKYWLVQISFMLLAFLRYYQGLKITSNACTWNRSITVKCWESRGLKLFCVSPDGVFWKKQIEWNSTFLRKIIFVMGIII